MKCKKIEKWLSDNIDGTIGEKQKKKLRVHLEECASCRSYAKSLERIQKGIASLEKTGISPEYWKEFDFRLMRKLRSLEPRKRVIPSFISRWKWAWSAAAFVLLVAFGLAYFFLQPKRDQEIYIFSFEDSLERIYQEIENNSELENLFNSVILSSIEENLEESKWEMKLDFYEDPLLWESLTEEEIQFFESEIKKEMKS